MNLKAIGVLICLLTSLVICGPISPPAAITPVPTPVGGEGDIVFGPNRDGNAAIIASRRAATSRLSSR